MHVFHALSEIEPSIVLQHGQADHELLLVLEADLACKVDVSLVGNEEGREDGSPELECQ